MSYMPDRSLPGTGFRTRWSVAGDVTTRTVFLPIIANTLNMFTVDWGDGTLPNNLIEHNLYECFQQHPGARL
jgi:hypothetical protein